MLKYRIYGRVMSKKAIEIFNISIAFFYEDKKEI